MIAFGGMIGGSGACRTAPFPLDALPTNDASSTTPQHDLAGPAGKDLTTTTKPEDFGVVDLPPTTGTPSVLIVINSESGTTTLRERLRTSIAPLFSTLVGFSDWHLAITSADLGTGMFTVEGCSIDGDQGVLNPTKSTCSNVPSMMTAATSPDPAAYFSSCYLGTLTAGCRYQQPLAAAFIAASQPGFITPGGKLVIIIISDTEDCSVTPNSDLFDSTKTKYGPASDLRCFMQGAKCNKSISTTAGGNYSMCAPLETDGLLVPPQVFVDQSIAALMADQQGPSSVMIFPITAQVSTQMIATSPGGLTGTPVCQLNQGEFALPSIRLDQIVDPLVMDGLDTVCATSWEKTFALVSKELLAP